MSLINPDYAIEAQRSNAQRIGYEQHRFNPDESQISSALGAICVIILHILG
jgi:hypothetical protein